LQVGALTSSSANAFNILAASYFHKVAPDVEAGAKAVWDKKTDGPVAIEVGSKYLLDRDAFVKAKVNNAGILGLGYTQNLRPGVKLQLGGNFDTTRLNENGTILACFANLRSSQARHELGV